MYSSQDHGSVGGVGLSVDEHWFSQDSRTNRPHKKRLARSRLILTSNNDDQINDMPSPLEQPSHSSPHLHRHFRLCVCVLVTNPLTSTYLKCIISVPLSLSHKSHLAKLSNFIVYSHFVSCFNNTIVFCYLKNSSMKIIVAAVALKIKFQLLFLMLFRMSVGRTVQQTSEWHFQSDCICKPKPSLKYK